MRSDYFKTSFVSFCVNKYVSTILFLIAEDIAPSWLGSEISSLLYFWKTIVIFIFIININKILTNILDYFLRINSWKWSPMQLLGAFLIHMVKLICKKVVIIYIHLPRIRGFPAFWFILDTMFFFKVLETQWHSVIFWERTTIADLSYTISFIGNSIWELRTKPCPKRR